MLVLEGHISVEAAIRGQARPVERVYIRQGKQMRKLWRLQRSMAEFNVPVEYVAEENIAALAEGKSHGGIIAVAGERHFASLEQLLPENKPAAIVMLDGVEDPYNLGQAVRVLYVAGVDGVVLRPRDWGASAKTIIRASAGAFELMPISVVDSAETAATFYRQHKLTIACAAEKNAVSVYDSNFNDPFFLLIGGAKRGITRSFLNAADMRIKIPYAQPFAHSLGTTSSAAIFASEIMRQRS